MVTRSATRRSLQAGLLAGSLLVAAGCKQTSPNANEAQQAAAPPASITPAPRSDQEIANDIQSRINAESALNGQNIQVNVNAGTATLNGSVNNDAARALAAADSGAAKRRPHGHQQPDRCPAACRQSTAEAGDAPSTRSRGEAGPAGDESAPRATASTSGPGECADGAS